MNVKNVSIPKVKQIRKRIIIHLIFFNALIILETILNY